MRELDGGQSDNSAPYLHFIGILAFFPWLGTAYADCLPSSPTSGGTVVCDGNPNGFNVSGLENLKVQIQPNTNLNGPFSADDIGTLAVDSSGNLQRVILTDISHLEFDNRAIINGGLTVTGDGTYAVHNYQNSFINSAFSFTGDSTNVITNDGTLNNGVTISGDGKTSVTNTTGASLNSGVFVNGSSQTLIRNYGTIQSTIALGSGDDTIINRDPGQINGSVSQGAGNDLFVMQGGRVSATVNQDSGSDRFSLFGGEVTGSLLANTGTDNMLWTGGLIGGIDMGADNDAAVFRGLTDTNLKGIQIDGGLGSDRLTWEDTQGSNPQRLVNWERIELLKQSELTMNSNLTLGDSVTSTGILSIDSTSYLRAGGGSHVIAPLLGSSLAQVRNSGVIDLTSGSNSTSDSLIIQGDYRGIGGRLWLNTVLGDDNSPSDKLVISGGTATGSTGIAITNVNGSGAQTEGNGILVVEATAGGTTGEEAFYLARRVVAGVYEYQLVRGGAAGSTNANWYLRNNFSGIDSSLPDLPEWLLPGGGGEEGGGSGGNGGGSGGGNGGSGSGGGNGGGSGGGSGGSSGGGNGGGGGTGSGGGSTGGSDGGSDGGSGGGGGSTAGGGSNGGSGGGSGGNGSGGGSGSGGGPGGGSGGGDTGGGDGITLIRPEVPIMSATPTVVRGLLRVNIGTFHERHGEQSWFDDEAEGPAIWTRMFGDRYRQDLSTFADQRFSGNQWGIQAGMPVYRVERINGQLDTFGVMASYARGWGDMRARNIYGDLIDIGNIAVDAYSLGAYWTHTWDDEAYFDASLMHSWLSIDTNSAAGISTSFHGREWTASLEAGRKFSLSDDWTIEPQAQIYWQHQDFDDAKDAGGSIRYDNGDAWTGRAGLRLQGNYTINERPFSPVLLANIWHQFQASDTVHFGNDVIRPSWQETSLELGAGFTTRISENVSLYATASYEFNLGGEQFRLFSGRIGARVKW